VILDAATEVFGTRGYAAASIDEIAGAAGVSKALIYEHFGSKKALQDELLAHHAGELFERLAANAVVEGTPEQRLRGAFDAFFGFVEERRGGWRMLFRDAADPGSAEALARLQDQAAAVVTGLLAAETDADEPEGLAAFGYLLSGALQALAAWWAEHPELPREWVVTRALEFCWLGLERVRDGARAGALPQAEPPAQEASGPPR